MEALPFPFFRSYVPEHLNYYNCQHIDIHITRRLSSNQFGEIEVKDIQTSSQHGMFGMATGHSPLSPGFEPDCLCWGGWGSPLAILV